MTEAEIMETIVLVETLPSTLPETKERDRVAV